MTNIAESVEQEFQTQINKAPTRKSGMLEIGTIGTIAYGIAASLPKLFPDYFPDFGDIDTMEYVKLSAMGYPIFLGASVGAGALKPEIHKLSAWIVYKPIELVGKGIDYISTKFKD